MFFKNFFKPKWQSNNPQARRQALRDLDPARAENQSIFQDVLRNDADPINRQTVLRFVCDLPLIQSLAKQDSDATVREHAAQRLRRLLCGGEQDSPSLTERLAFLETLDDSKLLEFIARQGKEAALREALMLRINREALYADLALQDSDADVRMKALSHIAQRATLERVLKGARTKDKRIRIAAQDRLNELTAHEERPEHLKQQARQLCARMDSLLVALRGEPDSIRLRSQRQEIDKEWEKIHSAWKDEALGDFDDKISERYLRACEATDQFLKGYAEQAARKAAEEQAYEPVRKEKDRLFAELTALAKDIDELTSVDEAQLTQLQAQLANAQSQWQNAGELPAEETRKTEQVFKEVFSRLTRRAEDMQRYLAATALCLRIIDKAQAEQPTDIKKRLASLEKLWGQLERPQHFKLDERIVGQAQATVVALHEQLREKEQAREHALGAFQKNLQTLEKDLVEGKFKHAASQLRQVTNSLKALGEQDLKHLRESGDYARYQRANGQLRELRELQGWASNPHREELCAEIETLAQEIEACSASSTYDFHAASKKIQQARKLWKGLGPAEGEGGDELWERFNQACNRAYEPCQKFFDQETQTREQNRLAKEAICNELETYFQENIEGKDLDQVDWKRVDRLIATSLVEWKKTGLVDRRVQAVLRDRFNAALQTLKDVLKVERDRNKEQKELLIANAEKTATALIASDKSPQALRDAAAAIKLIQSNWKEIGYASDEGKLWTRFRAVCDNVFNERQAQFDFAAEERRNHLTHKETLCELVERMSELSGEELKSAHSRFDEVKAEWQTVGEVPHEANKAVESRFAAACRHYEQALRKQAQREAHAGRENLYRKHELCVQLEVLADALLNKQVSSQEAAEQLAKAQQAWADLADKTQGGDVDHALQERMSSGEADVIALIDDAGQFDKAHHQQLQQVALSQKTEWCLALEILAGVESPAEYEQDRMAMQIQMLAHKHGHDIDRDAQLASSIHDIESRWYSAQSPSALETIQLERRFQQARQALINPGVATNTRSAVG